MWLSIMVACLILQTANVLELMPKRHENVQEFMNISEIIEYWRYPSEKYEVLTEDGYYLQVNRIPYGVLSPGKTGPRPAVLLVHAILTEGRCWIANLPNNSLAFFLADAGYDVWLLNCRGTSWSRRHQNLSIDQEQFWEFTFHEMGIYDVPATIDFILQKTQQDALYYVGHSQGGTAGLIAFSVLPHLAQKVKLFMGLAPGYTLEGLQGPLKILVSLPDLMLQAIWGKKEASLFDRRMKSFNAKMCSYAGLDQLCLQTMLRFVGQSEHLNVSRTDVYAGICPDFVSVKTAFHWSQVFKSQQFKYFDYGSKNKEVYSMTTPPFYKIEDMIVPTAVWYGENDIITTTKSFELLFSRIPRLVFQKCIPSWNHLSLIWDSDAAEHLYPDMLFLMQQYK